VSFSVLNEAILIFAFDILGVVTALLCQDICSEECLRNDNFLCWVAHKTLKPHLHDTSLTAGWMFVYTIQPVVQPGLATDWTNSGCSFNTVVKTVVQPVVSCKWDITQSISFEGYGRELDTNSTSVLL